MTTAALVRRLERTSAATACVGAVLCWGLFGWRVGAGVLGGWLLSAVSVRALTRGVEALGPPPPGQEGARRASAGRIALGLTARYALLLLAGYVIIARLHLHPLGVLVGVSAVVIAAMVEAVRSWK